MRSGGWKSSAVDVFSGRLLHQGGGRRGLDGGRLAVNLAVATGYVVVNCLICRWVIGAWVNYIQVWL